MLFSTCRNAAAAAFAVVLSFTATSLTALADPGRLTLERALAEAFARSPELAVVRAEVEQVEAQLVSARTYPHDPELIGSARRREGGGRTSLDYDIALAQVVEIGGQKSQRVATATAEVEASLRRAEAERLLLAARVESAFVEALRRRELAALERRNTDLARSLVEVAAKRFESGAAAQMELNVARVQAGRAERERHLAEGEYEAAKASLAGVVGLDASEPLEIEGVLVLPPRALPTLEELTSSAAQARADLAALRAEEQAARERIELERSTKTPNLAFEVSYGEEEETDRLIGGGIGVRIPLFDRNQGGIAAARAAQRRAASALVLEELRMRQDIGAALARYDAHRRASEELAGQVLGTLDQNLALLQRSFEAGKTSWTEVLVFRREFVDVERDQIDATADAWLAGIELDLAAGRTLVPAEGGPTP